MNNKTLQRILLNIKSAPLVAINTSEFSASQINEVAKKYLNDRPNALLANSNPFPEMNNTLHSDLRHIKNFQFSLWTWEKSLFLLTQIKSNYPDKEVIIDIVVNDFDIPPTSRNEFKKEIPYLFPGLFKEIASNMGMEYAIVDNNPLLRTRFGLVNITFVFESRLRNLAKKHLKTIKKSINVHREEKIWVTKILEEIPVDSNSNFTIEEETILPLTNSEEVAVCNSILMNYYLLRQNYNIINIANFGWKCGYRGGAIAYYNIFGKTNFISNIFYTVMLDEGVVYDFF